MKIHKFGDDINTDYIISSRHKRDTTDCGILKKYIFADIRENMAERISEGDIIAAGHNFGCGSAMEVAALVVKAAGIRVIIAKSFARSYYRNAMNNGILLLEADTDRLSDGVEAALRLSDGGGLLLSFQGGEINCGKPNAVMSKLHKAGGLIEYLNEFGELPES